MSTATPAERARAALRAALERRERDAQVAQARRAERVLAVQLAVPARAARPDVVLAVAREDLAPGAHEGHAGPPGAQLWIGVPPRASFGYPQVLQFGRALWRAWGAAAPTALAVQLELPGAALGLDLLDCAEQLLEGLAIEMVSAAAPAQQRTVTLLVPTPSQLDVLRAHLDRLLGDAAAQRGGATWMLRCLEDAQAAERGSVDASFLQQAQRAELLTAFVAMPFAADMKDTFTFGIQPPARRAGFRAERLDLEHFTGNVVEQIRERIARAHVVIADLSYANPNVFLEIGFAWGKERETVLLWRTEPATQAGGKRRRMAAAAEPAFDVRGENRIDYASLEELANKLESRLLAIKPKLLRTPL